jgi:ectoine hydroxylase-related dioxygenase (phytanoyl-CoA dioxygenase family)
MNAECRGAFVALDSSTRLEPDGFQILSGLISHNECDALATELTHRFHKYKASSQTKIGGIRNLLRTCASVAQLASSLRLLPPLEKLLGKNALPVQAIFFDKNAESNWLVPWHQDLTIAVQERIETSGFGGWSVKDGVVHVLPPREVLEDLIILRLHLDDCDISNGTLRVLPGSHRDGKLELEDIRMWTKKIDPFLCAVPKGAALLMRPLLLHASSPADCPTHRRVLHIEYAMHQLPNGLEWFEQA